MTQGGKISASAGVLEKIIKINNTSQLVSPYANGLFYCLTRERNKLFLSLSLDNTANHYG
jgi:hypothetical protein